MKQALNVWVLGGDLRQEKLAGLLCEDGHSVHTYALDTAELPAGVESAEGLEGVGQADCVILPLPVSTGDGLLNAPMSRALRPLAEVLAGLWPGQFICGGKVGEEVHRLAEARGLTIHDYFLREELAVANAVPGALAV